jgi:signal transduction histidine kinase
MSIGRYGKVAGDWGRLPAETNRRRPGWRTPNEPDLRRGISIRDLSQHLLCTTDSDQAGALAKTIEALAECLRADRIRFYLSSDFTSSTLLKETGHRRFELGSKWQRAGSFIRATAGSGPSLIELDSLPNQGVRLSRGEPLEAPFGLLPKVTSVPSPTMWSRPRTCLYIPCLGHAGLLGFFRVESRLGTSGTSSEVLDESSLIATLFAGFLERQRLSILLGESQKKKSHDERLEKLGLLTSSVAHDFNNYLTAILGYADLAEMEIAESQCVNVEEMGPGQSELSEIRNAATAAGELVEQILSSARQTKEGSVSLDLSESIRQLEGMLARVLGDEIDLDLQLDDLDERVLVAANRLERVLLNLASNARDALLNRFSNGSSGHGRFALSTTAVEIGANSGLEPEHDLAAGRYVRLSVRDNGCGIEREDQARIFERFYTTRAMGTGLGLASVAEFMVAAGGAICVESTPNVGTVFHLYFPVDSPADSGTDMNLSRGSVPIQLG